MHRNQESGPKKMKQSKEPLRQAQDRQGAGSREHSSIFNAQESILNECSSSQCLNLLNRCIIGHSLSIEHCQLNIATTLGVAQ